MTKRWVKKQTDLELAEALQSQFSKNNANIHPVLCQLLVQREVVCFDTARDFFRPSLEKLHDPFLMKDMDKAIDRIQQAMANKEKMLVYGDYDVDGTTSVALVYSFLSKYYIDIDYYIPDRYKEGYGISKQGIDWAKEKGFTLIIALDCGIKSIDLVEYATELGIDFIICDHHLPSEDIPKAAAVLDPKRPDCSYPYKDLSGCGIGYKLMQAYCKRHGLPEDELRCNLDLVAISIASDIVPILGENRILAYFGLKQINETPREGIKAILELAAVKKELSISDIVFLIGPRINAAGRIDDAKNAVKLLLSDTQALAVTNAEVLNQKNSERRRFDSDITREAMEMIAGDDIYKGRKTTVLFKNTWHKGVIGIVASRLLDVYYRPTIVLTESNGMAAGSARSVSGFDIYSAIKECGDLLEQFGGHMYAAGLTMKLENVPLFIEKFEQVVCKQIQENMLTPEIVIDAELKLSDITPGFFKILKQFSPFGPGNMKPVFLTSELKDSGGTRIVGNDHLRISLRNGTGATIHGIGFGLGEFEPLVKSEVIDMCYCLEESEWNGERKLDLVVKDIKPHAVAVTA